MFNKSRIFVSGATGSWGQALINFLLKNYDVAEIVCFSRGELQQVLMKRKFNSPKLKFVIGDVRDYDMLKHATRNIDYVFHLAALKHVPICETNVQETIKTNIIGTMNIVNVSIENKIKKVINVSSDKAVEPINLYGMTKATGEKIVIQANDLSDYTKFICIRGGNVMGTSGSVIPLFIEQIKSTSPLTVTNVKMTRFFLTLEEAISLLFRAAINGIGGEIFVMNMPSYYIVDLADVLMEAFGRVEIVETGIRPGEKLDEVLIAKHESLSTYCCDENFYVVIPTSASRVLLNKYGDFEKFHHEEFSSRAKTLGKKELKEMLERGRFI